MYFLCLEKTIQMNSCQELDILDTDGVKLERVTLQTTDPCLLLDYVHVSQVCASIFENVSMYSLLNSCKIKC